MHIVGFMVQLPFFLAFINFGLGIFNLGVVNNDGQPQGKSPAPARRSIYSRLMAKPLELGEVMKIKRALEELSGSETRVRIRN